MSELRTPIDDSLWTALDERILRDFARLVERVESHSLARLALQVAVSEYRELIVEAILARLDELAKTITPRLPDEPTTLERIEAVRSRLFDELKFWGDQNEPDNPRNSYLNDVLKRKVGLPITLCITYLAVGERLGTAGDIVAIPGLYLARHHVSPVEDVFIDVYHGGALLGHAELADLVRSMTGGRYEWGAAQPEPVGHRGVVTGLLTDLKGAYARRADARRLLRVHNYLLTLNPKEHREWRERATTWVRLGRPAEARHDYERYLALEPDAPDADDVRAQIDAL